MQASTLQRTCCGPGAALGASVATCAAVADAGGAGAGLKAGATIGAPIFALGVAGAGEVTAGPIFAVEGAGAGEAIGALAVALGAVTGGAVALKPALVSTIGDIGADSQSRPSNTLPSAIANTAP